MGDLAVVSEHTPPVQELVVAICAAVGTDLAKVQDELTKNLEHVGFEVHPIRVSELISAIFPKPDKATSERDRIDHFMEKGNLIRKTFGHGDALARLAVAKISELRTSATKPTAFIINSLKHSDEYFTLQKLYGDAFLMISVVEPREVRHQRLCKKISQSVKLYDAAAFSDDANALIDKDQEEADSLGQSVGDTFPLADAFVSAADVARQIDRLFRLVFGYPFVSPTRDEYGMFHASSAARRSSDLSRQVGAVVVSDSGDVIAMGCNEVPRTGGGAYWEDENDPLHDRRDFQLGWDSVAAIRKEALTEIVAELRKAAWLPEQYKLKDDGDVADEFLKASKGFTFRDKRVANVIEYGRIVHAEMSALMDAARRGVPMLDRSMFCTTFPCHMCARHIISSGLQRVVYIEPYPKSLAKRLYEKEICVDNDTSSFADAVKFEPFVGIAPKRFMSWFEFGRRKDGNGYALSKVVDLQNRKVAIHDVDAPTVEEDVLIKSLEKLESLYGN